MKTKQFFIILIVLTAVILAGCQDGLNSISFQSSKATKTAEAQETSDSTGSQQDQEQQAADCTLTDPHPVAVSIADKYQWEYQEIIDWYCIGYPFEDILVALQTSKLADVEPIELLERSAEQDWFEIWEDLGLNP